MDLPCPAAQRDEVVRRTLTEPWQPVAAVHASGAARIQRAVAIGDGGQRYGAEQQTAREWGGEKHRQDLREDVEPERAGQRAAADDGRETAVGGRHQPAGERDALRLVAVEQ